MTSRLGAVLVGAGLLVVAVAAVNATNVAPSWFDAEEGCRQFGRCPGPGTDAALVSLGVMQAAGAAAVLVGFVLRVRAVPAGGPVPGRIGWKALTAGALGAVLTAVFGPATLVGLFLGPHLGVAAILLLGTLQAVAVTTVLTGNGPATRAARVAGPVASAAALLTTSAAALVPLLNGGPPWTSVWSYALLHGAVLAGVVLLLGRGVTRPQAAGLLVLAAAGIGFAALPAVPDDPPPFVASAPPVPVEPEPVPAPVPVETPPVDTPPVPEPEPVVADVACDPTELAWSTTGWDGAMGRRSATVVARHDGPAPCFVEGVPAIELRQGGRPLRLTVAPGDAFDPQEVSSGARVGIAPGGSARFALTWRSYGAAADSETPQILLVRPVPDGPDIVVLLDTPAPFDLLDGGTVLVSDWS